jgi:hypothetical protein
MMIVVLVGNWEGSYGTNSNRFGAVNAGRSRNSSPKSEERRFHTFGSQSYAFENHISLLHLSGCHGSFRLINNNDE